MSDRRRDADSRLIQILSERRGQELSKEDRSVLVEQVRDTVWPRISLGKKRSTDNEAKLAVVFRGVTERVLATGVIERHDPELVSESNVLDSFCETVARVTDDEINRLLDEAEAAPNESELHVQILCSIWFVREMELLTRIATNRLRDGEVAQELVNETWLSLGKLIQKFNPRRQDASLMGQVKTVVKRKCRDHLRKCRRYSEVVSDYGRSKRGPDHESQPPIDKMIVEEIRESVRDAMEQLDTLSREIVHLRYGENLRHREIADICGITEENCRKRLHRAKETLRKLLTDEQPILKRPKQ